MVRAFVALEVPLLANLVAPSSEGGSAVHLTLRFLGEVEGSVLDTVRRELERELANVPAVRFTLAGFDAFPSRERPRVVFRGVDLGRDALIALAGRVESAVTRCGVAPEGRPFVPHVTVLRVRSPAHAARARALLAAPGTEPAVEVDAREVLLVRSELTRSGPVHTPLARFPLAGTPPGDP
ncbi:MAG: RNA 2',3'-cyclic phosphodiesterase [Thermoplasmata archaeon]|nr:RNA 2',3'-cyclic phosphodiesterase [Thermoplasmata archaeon]